ncbi:hypothetical protein BJX96DRAFT_150576, partial [Aspergillus floccosus]
MIDTWQLHHLYLHGGAFHPSGLAAILYQSRARVPRGPSPSGFLRNPKHSQASAGRKDLKATYIFFLLPSPRVYPYPYLSSGRASTPPPPPAKSCRSSLAYLPQMSQCRLRQSDELCEVDACVWPEDDGYRSDGIIWEV